MLMANMSFADIQPRAVTALKNSPIHELRDVAVELRGSQLLLSGGVSSFYHKQLAQEVVWAVCKNLEVELVNLIEVSAAGRSAGDE